MKHKLNVNRPAELVTVILGLRGEKDSLTVLRKGKSEFFSGKAADRVFRVLQRLSENGNIKIQGYDAWHWEDPVEENPRRKCFERGLRKRSRN
jgi:hypothetical protein